MKMRVIFAVKNTTKAVTNVMNMKPKKIQACTHDPCDIDAVLYQLI